MEIHDSFPSFDSSTDKRMFCGSDSQFWISDLYSLLFYSLQTPTALCTDKQLQPTSLRATMAHLLFSTPDLTRNYDIQTTVKRILTVEKAPFWRQPLRRQSLWFGPVTFLWMKGEENIGKETGREESLIEYRLVSVFAIRSKWSVYEQCISLLFSSHTQTCHYFLSHQLFP